jgi:hypothetical protein
LFALGELFTKHTEARIRNIVVGRRGRKIPITPMATNKNPDTR